MNAIVEKIIFNRPAFYIFLVLIFITSLGLLCYGSCANKLPNAKDISMYPLERPPVSMPMEFYISNDFSDNQIKIITKAAEHIEKSFNYKVKINLKTWIPEPQFSENEYLINDKKTIWKKSAQNEEVLRLLLKHSLCADGISKGDFVLIVDEFNNIKDDKLFVIVVHELMHQLGMEHIYNDYPAAMNIGGNNANITIYDKIQFCYIYNCSANSI